MFDSRLASCKLKQLRAVVLFLTIVNMRDTPGRTRMRGVTQSSRGERIPYGVETRWTVTSISRARRRRRRRMRFDQEDKNNM
uniref:Uncharacterized protein n=1 Tax=Oryza glumipatula TaxID=40148 RepID=A0A0E0AUG5_9ORYZ